HAQIVCGRQAFDLAAKVIVAEGHGKRHCLGQGEQTSLPISMEHRLIRLPRDRAEAVHAAHVVDAVHTRAVPIMPSRVTRPASASSLRPSAPFGRWGRTM